MEEALLSHKLEAMRVVNAQIADPVLRTSDGCLSLIAALALVEVSSGVSRLEEARLMILAGHRAGWATMLPPRRISRGCLR